MKVTAQEIQKKLMSFVKGGYDVVLPNFYYGHNECDVFRINESDFVFEYEIKISRGDYFDDFKKEARGGKKHDIMACGSGKYCPNRFYFVTPMGLIMDKELPPYAGLIEYDRGHFVYDRVAKLIHKNKFTGFRTICHQLGERDTGHKRRINELKNFDYEREISQLKREVAVLEKWNKEIRNENFMLKTNERRGM